MDRKFLLTVTMICILFAGVGGQSPATSPIESSAAPTNSPSTSPDSPYKPKSTDPAISPASLSPESTPVAATENTPEASPPVESPQGSGHVPVIMSPLSPTSEVSSTPQISPLAPSPETDTTPAPSPETNNLLAPVVAPSADVPAPAPSKHKKTKKNKTAPAPAPELLSPPAPPGETPGPSDAFAPVAADDQSGAESRSIMQNVMVGVAAFACVLFALAF